MSKEDRVCLLMNHPPLICWLAEMQELSSAQLSSANDATAESSLVAAADDDDAKGQLLPEAARQVRYG